jgi:hypothetical protein
LRDHAIGTEHGAMTRYSFVVLGGADLPWIYPLGVELARFGPAALVCLRASRTLTLPPPAWPFEDDQPNVEKRVWTYPSGFNGSLSMLFNAQITRRVDRLVTDMARVHGAVPYVVVPEAAFGRYTAHVDAAKLIYWNYDDHAKHAADGARLEDESETALARRAAAVICSSRDISATPSGGAFLKRRPRCFICLMARTGRSCIRIRQPYPRGGRCASQAR